MRGIALCCAGVALAGCSLLLSTSDFSAEPSRPDGGSNALDASDDRATPTEDGSGGDAGGPDGARADDAASAFCTSLNPKPKLCFDFDTGAVGDGFDDAFVDPSSAGAVTKVDGVLSAKIANAPTCSYVGVEKKLPISGKSAHVKFAFRPVAGWDADRIFFLARLNGGSGCAVLLHVSPGDANFHEQYGSPQQDDIFAMARRPGIGAWSTIDVRFLDSAISVDVDGMNAITQPLSAGCSYGTQINLRFGFYCATGTFEAQYDDIVVDYP